VQRRIAILAVIASALLLLGLSAGQALAAGDDDIPGVPISTSPVMGYLAARSDMADVMSIAVRQNDRLSFTVNGEATLFDNTFGGPRVKLFSPDAMSISGTNAVAYGNGSNFPITLDYNAASAGTYYIVVKLDDYAYEGYGTYSLAWTCQSPTITALTSRPKTVRLGSSATVVGLVKYDADSAPVAGQSVTLQRRPVGGKWSNLTSKATDSTGHFSFKVKPRKATFYRVLSPLTATLLRSTSNTVKYKVR
jgi:hypothetical protein